MPTLNSIASEICDALGRPFDWMFHARVKELIKHERATIIKQTVDKHGMSGLFIQEYNPTLILTTNQKIYYNKKLLRTENIIPQPIRHNTDILFEFVGNEDGVSYTYVTPTEGRRFRQHLPFVCSAITYTYLEGHIYLFNNAILKRLVVRAAYDDWNLNDDLENGGGIPCFDDSEFPLTSDLIQTIKIKLVSQELNVTDSKDKIPAEHIDNK